MLSFPPSPSVRIFVARETVDMRKGIDGLTGEVIDVIDEDPQSGHLFVFFNRRRDRMKALMWDGSGFWILYKRIEHGRSRSYAQGASRWTLTSSGFRAHPGRPRLSMGCSQSSRGSVGSRGCSSPHPFHPLPTSNPMNFTLGLLCVLSLAPSAVLASPQGAPSVVVQGLVRGPDGLAVGGALVTSNLGGRTSSAQDGSFALSLEPPLGAAAPRISAFAQGAAGQTLAGSLPIVLPATAGALWAGELHISAGVTCEPEWLPTFGEHPGTNGAIQALAVFDDGSGPALFATGNFNRAGSSIANRIAKWDGERWFALGSGISSAGHALAVFDDGGGPALYVAGDFQHAGGLEARYVARWDGSSWSALGSGLSHGARSLAVHDDGSGPALYVGGFFASAGGVGSPAIARWDGANWSAVGGGANSTVLALTVHDDGAGPALYAGGMFTSIGGVGANHVARWDGLAWSALDAGTDGFVRSLVSFDGGGGSELFAGGDFGMAGSLAAAHVARWDGSAWSALGSGTDGRVNSLAVHDGGSGPALFASGQFQEAGGAPSARIARWDGSAWSALGDGLPSSFLSTEGRALASFARGASSALVAGGSFFDAGPGLAHNAGAWDGTEWSPLGTGIFGQGFGNDTFQIVESLAVFDDGSGPALYVGGSFEQIGSLTVNHIARWDGSSWSALAGGLNDRAATMAVFDDGSGPALYVGGWFTQADGIPANYLARWDGTSWSTLPGPVESLVKALAVFDDGTGPALYVGGWFQTIGAGSFARIARWDGTAWSALGSGTNAFVGALTVFDDGTGSALYAGGTFGTAGGVNAFRVAKWDGSAWSALGSGLNGAVRALGSFDSGSGPALHVGGEFSTAGGQPASRIARWDGAAWSALGSGLNNTVEAMTVFDDGRGPALFAGGTFSVAGGTFAQRIARWDGTSWSSLDSPSSTVAALLAADLGSGSQLYVGGHFRGSPAGDSYLAVLAPCASVGTAFCFGDSSSCPCGNAGAPDEGCANSTGSGATLTGLGSASVASDDLEFLAAGLVPGQSALLFVGANAVNGGAGTAFGDGLRCAGGNVRRLGVRLASPTGTATWGPALASQAGSLPGQTERFQAWYRDPLTGPCATGFNYSHGLEITFH